MQYRSDDDYDSLGHESLGTFLKALKEYIEREMDIERTRHLKIWHDLSTIANRGHLVFMVSSLYELAIDYTNAEYESLTGCKNVDVQM